MIGPQALTITQIAAAISRATGKPVTYASITPQERKTAMLAASVPADVPADVAEALYDQAVERLKHPRSGVSLQTHTAFGVKPTTFAEFASRHAATFTAYPAALPPG